MRGNEEGMNANLLQVNDASKVKYASNIESDFV